MTTVSARLERLEASQARRTLPAAPPPYPAWLVALIDGARRDGVAPADALAARLGMRSRELRDALERRSGG
jgi:hypothetical protein